MQFQTANLSYHLENSSGLHGVLQCLAQIFRRSRRPVLSQFSSIDVPQDIWHVL